MLGWGVSLDMWDPSSLARDQTHTPALEGGWPGREGPVTVRVMLLSYVPKKRGVRGINRSTEGIVKLRCRVYIGAHRTSEGVLDTNGYPKLQNNFMNSRDGREFCRYQRGVPTEARLET